MRGTERRKICSCPKALNGLPVVPLLSTHTAAQLVRAGKPFVDLRTREKLDWSTLFPHLPLDKLAARPNLGHDSPLNLAQVCALLGVCGECGESGEHPLRGTPPVALPIVDSIHALTDIQRTALFEAAMRDGDIGTAFGLLKGKQKDVQLQFLRWLHPSAGKFESMIKHTRGHGLLPGDSKFLQPSLARWRSSMTKSRRILTKAAEE